MVFMDGDRQNDPHSIPADAGKLDEGYDVVSGWRKDRQDARAQPQVALADGQQAHLARQRRAAARLRLHAEGLPRAR